MTVVVNLIVPCHAVFKLDHVAFESLRFQLVSEDRLTFLRSFGHVEVVLAKVEYLVVDFGH